MHAQLLRLFVTHIQILERLYWLLQHRRCNAAVMPQEAVPGEGMWA